MRMQAGSQDIFGRTQDGVPSPLVPHVHPYPTRYHGPIFNQPMFSQNYVSNPYALAPYAGVGEVETKQVRLWAFLWGPVAGAGIGYKLGSPEKRVRNTIIGLAAGLVLGLGLSSTVHATGLVLEPR